MASVLRVKMQPDGPWVDIPAIQGVQGEQGIQGEQGERGPNGIYVGSEEPQDADVRVWIDLEDNGFTPLPGGGGNCDCDHDNDAIEIQWGTFEDLLKQEHDDEEGM